MAGVLFMADHAEVLASCRVRLAYMGMGTSLPSISTMEGGWALGGLEWGDADDRDELLLDVSYVDDTAVLLASDSPVELCQQVRLAISVLEQEFNRAGHQLNFKPGKSEAVLRLRGPLAQQAWQDHISVVD
eukprot:2523504-Alexandrium_andersonii.AAC.1